MQYFKFNRLDFRNSLETSQVTIDWKNIPPASIINFITNIYRNCR